MYMCHLSSSWGTAEVALSILREAGELTASLYISPFALVIA